MAIGLIGEIFDGLRSSFDDMRYGQPVTRLSVAKAYCVPARNLITATFAKYGVKIHDYDEYVQMHSGAKVPVSGNANRNGAIARMVKNNNDHPMAQIATVIVSQKQAVWAEYLLLRTGQLRITGRAQNPKNQAWADRHGGNMPPAWQDGKPWLEKSCNSSRGIAALIKKNKGNR